MRIAAAILKRMPWRKRGGVIGIVFTSAGRLVLVRHSYVDGWYPPGGGRKRRETPIQALRRELREEIGLETWSAIEPVALDEPKLAAFVVRDAAYRPRRNLEIDEVGEFDRAAPPADTSPRLIALLATIAATSA